MNKKLEKLIAKRPSKKSKQGYDLIFKGVLKLMELDPKKSTPEGKLLLSVCKCMEKYEKVYWNV